MTEHNVSSRMNNDATDNFLIPYPWQQRPWQQLLSAWQQQKLPHAILLSGQRGSGKLHFATALSALLLCQQANVSQQRCGQCHGCQMIQAGHHPGLLQIQPQANSSVIKIEQIREIVAHLTQTTPHSQYKIVIIEPAEALNMAAANALLKTLEEPPAQSLLLLIAHQPAHLPATIRSRCQQIRCNTDSSAMAAWLTAQINDPVLSQQLLKLSDDAPLLALQYASGNEKQMREQWFNDFILLTQQHRQVTELAKHYAKADIAHLLNYLLMWISDVICWRSTADETVVRYFVEPKLLQPLSTINLPSLFKYWDKLLVLQQSLQQVSSLNTQFILEDILFAWLQLLNEGNNDYNTDH